MGCSCLACCNALYQIPTRIMCFVLVMIQGGILDYYLVSNKNIYWYGWVAADVALGLVFVMTFIISYRHLSVVHLSHDSASPVQAGSLPLGYFAWFVYSVFLGTRVFIIYRDVAWTLSETNVFGPNTLKMTVSGTGLVFLLLLLTHHNAVPLTKRKYYIEELTGTVVFDVLDSIDILNIFFNKSQLEDLPDELEISILIIACVNFLMPIFPLITLSRMHFGHKPLSDGLHVLHKLCLVFLTNLPLFVVRMLLWHVHSNDVSVFPMKNLIMIFLVFHDLYDKRRASARPKHVSYSEEKDQSHIEELEENKAMFIVEGTK